MNPNTQTKSGAITESEAKIELKKIGDQVEALAKKLETSGIKVDCEGLFEIGEQIEHFFDHLGAEKLIAKPDQRKSDSSSSSSLS